MRLGKHGKEFSLKHVFCKKWTLSMIAQVLFLFLAVVLTAETIYIGFLNILPLKYYLLVVVLAVFCCGIQAFLLLQKRYKCLLSWLSIAISALVLVFSFVLLFFLATFQKTVSALPEPQQQEQVEAPAVTVAKEPFIIYLSGLDTRGNSEIQEKGLSDVNMLIVVNPSTKDLLMVNIPRDYYVPLYGEKDKMDKLTHAGTFGVNCSMKTLNSLFNIECNYYVKVNFKSVVDIVDALGGITVTSDFDFSSKFSLSGKRYYFNKGENTLTGDEALAFARERKSFEAGDRQRGIHQQKVINAILKKAMSPAILNIKNLQNVLTGITDNTRTNISYDDISDLIRMQLNDMSAWNIRSISVNGTGTSMPSYASGGEILYVMIPDMNTVEQAKKEIEAVLNKTK